MVLLPVWLNVPECVSSPFIAVSTNVDVSCTVKSLVTDRLSFNVTLPVARSSKSAFDISVLIILLVILIVLLSNCVAITWVLTFKSLAFHVPCTSKSLLIKMSSVGIKIFPVLFALSSKSVLKL